MQLCRSIMMVLERNHPSTGRRSCWYSQGHSMLSKMRRVPSVEHHLRPNDRYHHQRSLYALQFIAYIYELIRLPSSVPTSERVQSRISLRLEMETRPGGRFDWLGGAPAATRGGPPGLGRR